MKVELRCCCEPSKVFGTIEMPEDIVNRASFVDLPMKDGSRRQFEIADLRKCKMLTVEALDEVTDKILAGILAGPNKDPLRSSNRFDLIGEMVAQVMDEHSEFTRAIKCDHDSIDSLADIVGFEPNPKLALEAPQPKGTQ